MGSKLPMTDLDDLRVSPMELQRIERQQLVELGAAMSRAAVNALTPLLAGGELASRTVGRLSPVEQRRLGGLSMDTRAALATVLCGRLRLSAGRASTWVC